MRTTEPPPGSHELRGTGPVFALAFGLTWGIVAPLMLFTGQIEAIIASIGYTHPLSRLAAHAPGFADVFRVWRHEGPTGLDNDFRRLALWRMQVA